MMQQETSPSRSTTSRRVPSCSPDRHSQGLVDGELSSLRYDGQNLDAWETPGLLRRLVKPGSKVLDVGCGTGSMTMLVTDGLGCEVLGVEPDPARADAARERGLEVVTGLLDEELLRDRGPFDVIILADVIEHLPSPGEMLLMLKEGLAPDGRILASVPNVAHWSVRMNLLLGKFEYTDEGIMDATHLRWFTSKTMRELFERCGFSIISFNWTAGVWMKEYRRLPARLLPSRLRRFAVRRISNVWPSAFGAQHIVEAKLMVGQN